MLSSYVNKLNDSTILISMIFFFEKRKYEEFDLLTYIYTCIESNILVNFNKKNKKRLWVYDGTL